jgi:DNA invertase Pin-like site-specific DNA recombinase
MSHTIDTSKNKYILYARKSTESDERQVASTADQIKVMKREIERENSRYEIVEVFEEQKSGLIPYRREKFDKMIQMLRDGEAQGIIA